jgi:hypothetical protein
VPERGLVPEQGRGLASEGRASELAWEQASGVWELAWEQVSELLAWERVSERVWEQA